MKIYRPRGITKGQLVLVTILGFCSGVYIWKPLLDTRYSRKKKEITSEADTPATQ